MKAILFFLLLPFVTNAQVTHKTFNNQIKSVNKMTIHNGNTYITHADTVTIITQSLKTKIYLVEVDESKDSLGRFITIYRFGNNEELPLFNVNLLMKFKTSYISFESNVRSLALNETYFPPDSLHKEIIFRAGQVNRAFESSKEVFNITVISNKKTTPTIYGIDGILF